jgi:transposase
MRQIRELLRLHFEEGFGERTIARAVGVVRSTVQRTLQRFAASKIGWPPDSALDDAALERRLYAGPANRGASKECARPNYAEVSHKLAAKGMTRRLLWERYREQVPDGIGYSMFCDELAGFSSDKDLAFRHDHVPGERCYIDFAGLTLRYVEAAIERTAHIFVAALGYSNATYAYAFANESAQSWFDGQHRAFVAFGGVPKVGVPDNAKALVAKADRYEPQITAGYRDFARHCGFVVVPARVRKPKDKAAVEGAVKFVEMRILAGARERVFPSLTALNAWLIDEIKALNERPFQKRTGSRASALAQERMHLQPLPSTGFEQPVYLKRKVARDYHVEAQRQYFSVPCAYVGEHVEVRVTGRHVEVYLRDTRIALHARVADQRFVTDVAHMPPNHRAYADPQILRRAQAIGPNTLALVEAVFVKRPHPDQAVRSAQGILALARDHGREALENAASEALRLGTIGYQPVLRLLRTATVQASPPLPGNAVHAHIRGSNYYTPEAAHVA